MSFPYAVNGGVDAHNLDTTLTKRFAVWFTSERECIIGSQNIDDAPDQWSQHQLTGAERTAMQLPVIEDAHCVPAIMQLGDGKVAIWGNLHATPLGMAKSGSAGSINPVSAAVMPSEYPGQMTYPTPIKRPNGSVRFYGRERHISTPNISGSGNSDSLIWDCPVGSSTFATSQVIFRGTNVPNAKGPGLVGDAPGAGWTGYNWSSYPHYPYVQDLGGGDWIEHWFWVWRTNVGADLARTNYFPSYMQYRSATNSWHAIDGSSVTLPVDPVNTMNVRTGLTAADAGADGYINGGGICLNPTTGWPHITQGRLPCYVITYNGTTWSQTQLGSTVSHMPMTDTEVSYNIIAPHVVNGIMYYIGTGSANGYRLPVKLWRVDGGGGVELTHRGPTLAEANNFGTGAMTFGQPYCGHPCPNALRLRGQIEVFMPNGDTPMLYTFGGK